MLAQHFRTAHNLVNLKTVFYPVLATEKYHVLLRVFVHVYIHHFDRLTELEAEAHSNTLFKHYYYFVKEFQLVDEKEFEPLKELIAKICKD